MLLSKLSSSLSRAKSLPLIVRGKPIIRQPVRYGGHKKILYTFVSKQNSRDFIKHMKFYTALGLVPSLLLMFYTSYVVGEAELYDYDMDQYEPEFYEFFAHPITRFLARYCMEDPKLSYYKDIYAIELKTSWTRLGKLCDAVEEMESNAQFRRLAN
uniref:NADH dehydrogenase [ubiquinone] 1 beta subcomplex subunit 5, mitochondrial-like n=1 Tax=Styela clava TaxID=7725 RepID=UPI001939695D|nr:NADH dehydrogenase [ubiquinone] 1 beta subcomplex subunit 5, mitochondrial-like [Styela clava]